MYSVDDSRFVNYFVCFLMHTQKINDTKRN